jgi:hypothetical protein
VTARRLEARPLREELEAIARHYHHLQNEHKHAARESGARRRLDARLLHVRERFDRLVLELPPDDEARRAWSRHLHYREPMPTVPPAILPLVFSGKSDAGSMIEIRGRNGDELAVEIDGSLVERIAASKDLAVGPSHRFRLDQTQFDETFNASDEALDALAGFVADGGPPPWEHFAELYADGLVDANVALTPRGRRALAPRPS